MYFPFAEEAANVETLTAWVSEVRAIATAVGSKRGDPILLSVRVMAKPEQNVGLGLDPATWATQGVIDIVVVLHFLHNHFTLPIGEYRRLLPGHPPLYGSIEIEPTADRQAVVG